MLKYIIHQLFKRNVIKSVQYYMKIYNIFSVTVRNKELSCRPDVTK